MSKKLGNKKFYPYARIKAMNEIVEFIKTPGWRPDIINIDLLKMLGIGPSKEREVINSLMFFGLITKEGNPTEKFEALKDNYSSEMMKIVNREYSDLFNIIPPKLIDQERIINFFITSSGVSRDTAEYQAMFFSWACREAGIDLPNLPESIKRSRFDKLKNN